MAKTIVTPSTPWTANSTNPPADQNYQDGDRPASGLIHGALRSFTVTGFGDKTDYNSGAYDFQGSTHMQLRNTDFDEASTAIPAANTEAGWKAHLDGLYPILTSDDFNINAAADGATLELTGGPTQSGKYLQRKSTGGNRLRNWNVLQNDTTFRPFLYVSCLIHMPLLDSGKYIRTYWVQDGNDPDTNNVYLSKATDEQPAWNVEANFDSWQSGYGDQTGLPWGDWIRVEQFINFTTGQYWHRIDGRLITDTSRGFNGPATTDGQVGTSKVLNYHLNGNTLDLQTSATDFVGWAGQYTDYSNKRIELADNAVWANRTKSVPQSINSVTDNGATSSVQIRVDQGDHANLTGKHLFFLGGANGDTAVYIGALV